LSRYGLSEGTPSESGLQLDAQAGFNFVANHPELSKSPIVGPTLGQIEYRVTCLPPSNRSSMVNHLAGLLPLTLRAGTRTKYNHTTAFWIIRLHALSQISALIVENTFSSIPHMVREWPMGRFLSLLTTQKWLSAAKIAGIPPALPILMLSGLRDHVIPPSEMVELWKVSKVRRPKKNTRWLWSALGGKDNEEPPRQPEKDVFESFRRGGHSTYLLSFS